MGSDKITREFLYNNDYERIESGEELNMLNKPYKETYLNNMISFFEEKQDFMKCAIIKKYIEDNFTHGKYWILKK